jgi:hypothetical protein
MQREDKQSEWPQKDARGTEKTTTADEPAVAKAKAGKLLIYADRNDPWIT